MTLQLDAHGSTGPAVVMLHGTPSTVAYLDPLIEALAPTHRVLAAYLPGYGSSPRLVPYSFEGARRSLEEALRDRGVTRGAVLGFSGGTYHALELALGGRFEATRLVGLGAFASLDPEERSGFTETAAALRAGIDLRPMLPARFLAPSSAKDPARVAAVLSWLDAAPREVVADELDAFAACRDLLPDLARLRVPVLLRTGALDLPTPPAKAEAIARVVPDAVVEVVPECAHALLLEDREATVASVRRFLDRPD